MWRFLPVNVFIARRQFVELNFRLFHSLRDWEKLFYHKASDKHIKQISFRTMVQSDSYKYLK